MCKPCASNWLLWEVWPPLSVCARRPPAETTTTPSLLPALPSSVGLPTTVATVSSTTSRQGTWSTPSWWTASWSTARSRRATSDSCVTRDEPLPFANQRTRKATKRSSHDIMLLAHLFQYPPANSCRTCCDPLPSLSSNYYVAALCKPRCEIKIKPSIRAPVAFPDAVTSLPSIPSTSSSTTIHDPGPGFQGHKKAIEDNRPPCRF